MKKYAESNPSAKEYFEIGHARGKRFFTNIAVAHEKGYLRNETLMQMSDKALAGYTTPEDYYVISDDGSRKVQKSMHRAFFILQYRVEKTEEGLFFKQQEDESMNALAGIEPQTWTKQKHLTAIEQMIEGFESHFGDRKIPPPSQAIHAKMMRKWEEIKAMPDDVVLPIPATIAETVGVKVEDMQW